MKTINKIAAIIAVVMASQSAFAQWETSSSVDEMSDEKSAYAYSSNVPSSKNDNESWLGFGCDKSGRWAYFGFDHKIILENDDIYGDFKARVRFDNDKAESWDMNLKKNGNFIHLSDDYKFIRLMQEKNVVKLELQEYRQNKPTYYKYSLSGSTAAINKAKELCE